MRTQASISKEVRIAVAGAGLDGELIVPAGAEGIVVFVHGSGSSRHSPRNKYVAKVIRDANLGTLLFDLLTAEEEAIDVYTRHLRFDIGLLARRLVATVRWLKELEATCGLNIGFFGSSTGAAAAILAAAELGDVVGAVVSRGGRPDLAGHTLSQLRSPTLLIVGELDQVVIGLNKDAYRELNCAKEMKIVPRATHLFEEPGALDAVANLAADWFSRYLPSRASAAGE